MLEDNLRVFGDPEQFLQDGIALGPVEPLDLRTHQSVDIKGGAAGYRVADKNRLPAMLDIVEPVIDVDFLGRREIIGMQDKAAGQFLLKRIGNVVIRLVHTCEHGVAAAVGQRKRMQQGRLMGAGLVTQIAVEPQFAPPARSR